MDEQDRVAAFVAEYDLDVPPAYRVLDLEAEVGELAKAVLVSTDYGATRTTAAIPEDELGDVLFAALALASHLDIDATAALEQALEKYETRMEAHDSPGSGA